MGVQCRHKQLAAQSDCCPTRVSEKRSRKGVDRGDPTKGNVSQNIPSSWARNRNTSDYTEDATVPSSFSRHVPFPTCRSSEMAPNTFSFTVGCPQATASNHKVVADCHSQIAVRALVHRCVLSVSLTDVFGSYLVLLHYVSSSSHHPS